MEQDRQVALVLSSGGARGYVHIGAIRRLETEGYRVTSVAGASIGALIGGMYAAGKLPEMMALMETWDMNQLFPLTDITFSMNHVIRGKKVTQALKQILGDVRIEDLPIPFTAIATDIKNYQEVVLDHGSLYEAIRASISIPSFFKPVKKDGRVLIDGGVINPLPLRRVKRSAGDLLVAVNVSAMSNKDIDKVRRRAVQMYKQDTTLLNRLLPSHPAVESNYFSLLSKTFSLMIQQNTELSLQITPPDVLVNIPMNRFGGFDYGKTEKMIKYGEARMQEALNDYRSLRRELSF